MAPLRKAMSLDSEPDYERPIPTLLEGLVGALLRAHSDQDFILEFRKRFYDDNGKLRTPFDSLQMFSHWLKYGPWAPALKSVFCPAEDKRWKGYVVCLRKRLRHESEPSYVRTLERELKKDLEKFRKQGQAKDQQKYLEMKGLARAVVNAAWLLCEPYHIHDGVPVLLTTNDTNVERLSNAFLRLLVRENSGLTMVNEESRKHDEYAESPIEKALKLHIQEFTVCRRLEIHDLPSPVLIHILQRNVEAAQGFLFHDRIPKDTRRRFEESWRIRLVIDDFSILRKSHPEISEEPLVLPFIMFYLRREGITSLVIDTQAGSPKIPATELEKELRTLIQHHLYTWRFPFYGENRIAIAAIPPVSNDLPAVVRELRERREDRQSQPGEDTPTRHPEKRAIYVEEGEPDVDPHFELYSGIEEGKPEPVPLEVRLYAETLAVKQYIRDENVRYRELFKPANGGVGRHAGDVMRPMQADEYEVFKDFCYLQRDTRLDHTLVCEVDDFWSLRRPGVRRAGAFRRQNKYLDSPTTYEGKINPAVDPFGVFQMTGQGSANEAKAAETQASETAGKGNKSEGSKTHSKTATKRRSDFFGNDGYKPDYPPDEKRSDRVGGFIDRIPFVWDFGFLLCRKKLWDRYSSQVLKATKKDGGPIMISDVWRSLPTILKSEDAGTEGEPMTTRASWREFLEACCVIAQEEGPQTPAFDLSVIAQESLACLILEIWASEIYSSRSTEKERDGFKSRISRRAWAASPDDVGLIEWLERESYRRQLFKSWLLLVEVLNTSELAAAIRKGGLKGRKGDRSAVAARYWYKTAGNLAAEFSYDDPLVPVGLPGHFSVRGDWFLAVASGSRSERLADRALDLLSSRRSNFSRLEQGIGLPTRDIGAGYWRTSLVTLGRVNRPTTVTYSELCSLGALLSDSRDQEFCWLWRSSLRDYSRHMRVFQEWLGQIILWWDLMRNMYTGDAWIYGFDRYDQVSRLDVEHGGMSDPEDPTLEQVWKRFELSLVSLKRSLQQASRATFREPALRDSAQSRQGALR